MFLGTIKKKKKKKRTLGEMVIYQKPAPRDSPMAMAVSFEDVSFHLRIFRKPLRQHPIKKFRLSAGTKKIMMPPQNK